MNTEMPGTTVVVGGNAFFVMWHQQLQPGVDYGDKILHYHFETGAKKFLQLPGASAWQYKTYDREHAAEDGSDVLHFRYRASGNRLAAGVDYPEGWYGFNVVSGTIARVECTGDLSEFPCVDGRYIFFEGSEAPINGYALVSSPVNSFRTKDGDVDRRSVRVLKRFSRRSGGYNSLNELSPCRRYALVCREEESENHLKKTYYAVNVTTGNTWMLLKYEVAGRSNGNISWVRWLDGT
jgi:hypothetical protein